MSRVDVDLLQMGHRGFKQYDVREPYWNVIREGDPEMASTLRVSEVLLTRSLGENGLRCMANKKSRGRELYERQQMEIPRPCQQ